jgi:hypothetical protein
MSKHVHENNSENALKSDWKGKYGLETGHTNVMARR